MVDSRDQRMQKIHNNYHMGIGGSWKDCEKCVDGLARHDRRLGDQKRASLNVWKGELQSIFAQEQVEDNRKKARRAASRRARERRATAQRRIGDRRREARRKRQTRKNASE